MSFWVWIELVCIDCASVMGGRHVLRRYVPRRELSIIAKKMGWVLVNTEWICRACIEKSKKENLDKANSNQAE